MDRDHYFSKMESIMWANGNFLKSDLGKIIYFMDMEFIISIMAVYIKENGKMVNIMDQELYIIKIPANMKETFKMGKNMGKDF